MTGYFIVMIIKISHVAVLNVFLAVSASLHVTDTHWCN